MFTPERIMPHVAGCTCTIAGVQSLRDTIHFCPLHAASPKLLEALESWVQCDFCPRCVGFSERRQAAISEAKGE